MVTTSPVHPYLAALQAYLGARYSPDTVSTFTGGARTFLKVIGTKKEYTREDVLRYADWLTTKGYATQSVNVMMASVKTLFRAMRWSWPVEKGDLHFRMPQEESRGVVIPGEDVLRLIRAARGLGVPERPAVALATTYGLRPNEIAQVTSKGLQGDILEIQTSKGGRKRVHQIPPVLREALTFRPYPISRIGLHATFDRLMKAHVREPIKGEGWHSVRRALVTGLYLDGASDIYIQQWMGWRMGKSIVSTYVRPDAAALDREIYAKHPFLRAWDHGF